MLVTNVIPRALPVLLESLEWPAWGRGYHSDSDICEGFKLITYEDSDVVFKLITYEDNDACEGFKLITCDVCEGFKLIT